MTSLSYFPAHPVAGPISILDLPESEWHATEKVNGCHAIVDRGICFTRFGVPMSAPKGAAMVLAACRRLPDDVAIEGEWVLSTRELFLFDAPHCPGDYEERFAYVADVLGKLQPADGLSVHLVPFADSDFRVFYESCKSNGAEGVVLKRRRNSLYEKCSRPGTPSRHAIKRRFRNDRV